jgi:hypothetical protein
MDNVVSVRLDEHRMKLLENLCKATGWNASQLIRHLLDNANVRPAVVSADIPKDTDRLPA